MPNEHHDEKGRFAPAQSAVAQRMRGSSVATKLRAAYEAILGYSKYDEHRRLGRRPPVNAAAVLNEAKVTPEELYAAYEGGELNGMQVANSTFSKSGGKPVIVRYPDGREKARFHGLVFEK